MTNRKLVIGRVGSADCPNLRSSMIDNPKVFSKFIQMDIGYRTAKKTEVFTVLVATPLGLSTLESKNGIIAESPLLVMEEFIYDDFMSWLEKVVHLCESDSWNECVEKLKRYFKWEYEYLEK